MIVISSINKKYGILNTAEKKVADYVIACPENVLEESAEAIAYSTKTSAATVIRFCKACGFSGLSDLRFKIRQEWNVLESSIYTATISQGDSAADIKQKVIMHLGKIMDAIMADTNDDPYCAAADALLAAKRIFIIGDSRSHPGAVCFQQICALLDLRCHAVIDELYEQVHVSQIDPGDVAIGFCYSGIMRNTVDSFRRFKNAGATTICIVGAMDSQLYNSVDILLHTHSVSDLNHISSFSTSIGHLIVLEILYAVLATKLGIDMELPEPPTK